MTPAEEAAVAALEQSRRAAWAKFYDLRRTIWRVGGMLFIARTDAHVGRDVTTIIRDADYALQRATPNPIDLDEASAMDYSEAHAAGYDQAARATRTGLGWPTRNGQCI